jgi:hypothetical protein
MLQSDGCIGGVVVGSGGVSGAVTGNKILSARERLTNCFWLWHQHGGQHGHSATTRNEFVRCLMLLTSKLRLPILTKTPPALLTEMALQELLRGTLPAERPQDGSDGAAMSSARLSGQKRSLNGEETPRLRTMVARALAG